MQMDDALQPLRHRLANIDTTNSLCPVQRLYSELDDETCTILQRLVTGPTSTTRIHAEIRAAGLSLSRDSLSYHRKGICRCTYNTND